MNAHAPIEHATALATPASFDRLVGVFSRNTRHRGGENTEDCSYPSRATIERVTIERVTIERVTIERVTIERVTIERATIEGAAIALAAIPIANEVSSHRHDDAHPAGTHHERGGHHLLMTSDPSTSARRLRPHPFDSSRKDPWRSWRHGALAVNPNGVLLPTGALAVDPNDVTGGLAVNPDGVGAVAVSP